MKKNMLLYYCRLGYLYLIDNMKKYEEKNGNINHRKAVSDCIKDKSIIDSVSNYIEWIWSVHGTDNKFIKKIRKAVRSSVYAHTS